MATVQNKPAMKMLRWVWNKEIAFISSLFSHIGRETALGARS